MVENERRLDYPEIKERLAILEVLQQKDIDDAAEWRKIFCDKLDKVSDKLNHFPCEANSVRLKEFDVFKSIVFRIVVWGVISLLAVSVAWGAMQMRINVDTDRITDIEKYINAKR